MSWVVYVLTSRARAVTYVGVTEDPERRLAQHNGERPGGAKATRAGRPWVVGAIYGPFESRGEALQAEYRVKQLTGADRLHWNAEA
jgi:structure-specific endonuclease subunit SLX1